MPNAQRELNKPETLVSNRSAKAVKTIPGNPIFACSWELFTSHIQGLDAYTDQMAQLYPDLLNFHSLGLGAYAERAVLEQLRDGLPKGFDVFHSVKWSTVDSGVQRFGEIDMVVVDPQGHLVLQEVKSGDLQEVSDPKGVSGFSWLLKQMKLVLVMSEVTEQATAEALNAE